MEEMRLDHLDQRERDEVVLIVRQPSPLRMEPRNQVQWAFLNEEVQREARLEMESQEDLRRWHRLIELGVIDNAEDVDFDWTEVDA